MDTLLNKNYILSQIGYPSICVKYEDDVNGVKVYEHFCANLERRLKIDNPQKWSEVFLKITAKDDGYILRFGFDCNSVQKYLIRNHDDLVNAVEHIHKLFEFLKKESESNIKKIQIETDFEEYKNESKSNKN